MRRIFPGIPYKVPVIHKACICDAFFLGRFRMLTDFHNMIKTMFSSWYNCLIFLLLPLVKWTRGLFAFQSKQMSYHNILVKGSIFPESLRNFEPMCYSWETNAWLCQERFPIFKRCQRDDDKKTRKWSKAWCNELVVVPTNEGIPVKYGYSTKQIRSSAKHLSYPFQISGSICCGKTLELTKLPIPYMGWHNQIHSVARCIKFSLIIDTYIFALYNWYLTVF